jgi:hypothetical protein
MESNQKIDLEKTDKEALVYLELLLDKKGMSSLPGDILADMIMDLYSRFESFLFLSVMQSMEADKYQKFDEFLATNPSSDQSKKFLEENVENFPAVIRKAMDEFESIYLGEKNNA